MFTYVGATFNNRQNTDNNRSSESYGCSYDETL